jgi:F-type H+-transporting ATPase subunit gamma
MLLAIEQWHFRQQTGPESALREAAVGQSLQHVEQIHLFYHRSRSMASFEPVSLQLLPLDLAWLHQLERSPWPSPSLPSLILPWESLFSSFIRQYLFVALYRAMVESLASENISRLASMQAAEKNIADRLTELQAEYRSSRQTAITGELLDIVAGFEALETNAGQADLK